MERDKLKSINPITVLKYIQQSIEILMSIRQESKPKPAVAGLESVEEKSVEDSAYDSVKTDAGPPREYEELV